MCRYLPLLENSKCFDSAKIHPAKTCQGREFGDRSGADPETAKTNPQAPIFLVADGEISSSRSSLIQSFPSQPNSHAQISPSSPVPRIIPTGLRNTASILQRLCRQHKSTHEKHYDIVTCTVRDELFADGNTALLVWIWLHRVRRFELRALCLLGSAMLVLIYFVDGIYIEMRVVSRRSCFQWNLAKLPVRELSSEVPRRSRVRNDSFLSRE